MNGINVVPVFVPHCHHLVHVIGIIHHERRQILTFQEYWHLLVVMQFLCSFSKTATHLNKYSYVWPLLDLKLQTLIFSYWKICTIKICTYVMWDIQTLIVSPKRSRTSSL